MKSATIERDHVPPAQEIASFGAALLVKHWTGKFEVIGGTKEERRRAREWAEEFMNNGSGVRW
jgi:hypothetical protein